MASRDRRDEGVLSSPVSDTQGDMSGRAVSIGLVGPLPPQVGGVASFITWLVAHERELGCRYTTFDLWRPPDDETGGRLRAGGIARQLRTTLRYLRWLRSAPQLIHYCVAGTPISLLRDVPLIAIARAAGRRVVAHVHNGHDLECARRSVGRRMLLRSLAAVSTRVVAIAPTCERWLRAIGIDATYVLNPVRMRPPEPAPAHPSDGNILFVGAYGEAKGVYDLVDAVALLVRRVPTVQVAVIGKALRRGDEDRLSKRIADAGLGAVIRIRPPADESELRAAYDSAALLCLPSRREGLPMSILEAMAHGVPVVASRVGAIPDVVEDGVTGFLVPAGDTDRLADAIAALLEDSEQLERMSAAALERVMKIADDASLLDAWRNVYDAAGSR